MLDISGRLRNIAILVTGRTIMWHSNFVSLLTSLFYRMWRHFLLDDPDTKKVPGVAECSPPPLRWIDRVWCFGLAVLHLLSRLDLEVLWIESRGFKFRNFISVCRFITVTFRSRPLSSLRKRFLDIMIGASFRAKICTDICPQTF